MDAGAPDRKEARAFHSRLVQTVLDLLRQGVTPEKIALCIAIGAAIGVFPVVGTTTLLCAMAAVLLRLNLPAILLVNYLVYPLQLALLLPFVRLGEKVFGVEEARFSPLQVIAQLRSDPWSSGSVLREALLHAVLAWLIAAPFAGLLIYCVLAPLLTRIKRNRLEN